MSDYEWAMLVAVSLLVFMGFFAVAYLCGVARMQKAGAGLTDRAKLRLEIMDPMVAPKTEREQESMRWVAELDKERGKLRVELARLNAVLVNERAESADLRVRVAKLEEQLDTQQGLCGALARAGRAELRVEELERKFDDINVSHSTISLIKHERTWRHVR